MDSHAAPHLLPQDALEEIFSFVPERVLILSCSRVCRRWYDVLRPSSPYWRHRCIVNGQGNWVDDCDWQRLAFYSPFNRSLLPGRSIVHDLDAWNCKLDSEFQYGCHLFIENDYLCSSHERTRLDR